jgi:hypothetical protein
MAIYGLDVECPHIFDGTHFARWKNWMMCNFKFIFPQMWWIVDAGFSHVLDENNLTQAQEKCIDLENQATNILYESMKDEILREIMDMETAYEIWIYLNNKYGMVPNDDDKPKKEAHEDVELIHNMVVVEDCSTSWSSDNDEQSTSHSLDKVDDDGSRDAIDDSTPSTLDVIDDGSCLDDIATISPSIPLHCFMSQGDIKVSSCNVIDHSSYDELVSRLAGMNIALENEMAKAMKLENENSFLKNACEQQKHLLYVISCSHVELKLTHEELSVAHSNLVQDHVFLTNKLSNKETKTSESSSHGLDDQL